MALVSVYEMEARSMANNFLTQIKTHAVKHMRIFKGIIRLLLLLLLLSRLSCA